MRALYAPLLALALWLPGALIAQEVELVMVEERGCMWCARWNAQVAPEYPKTPEGMAAPLRRIDLRDRPEDLTFETRLRFTPTFVLMIDGVEADRIEGYPGEDFFWPMLGAMLDDHTDWRRGS